jgi:hypothetical protein
MRVFDAHRLLGPIPTEVGQESEEELLLSLDHLRIDGAAVTPTYGVYGDPRDREHFDPVLRSDRLVHVPVIVPALAGAGSDSAGASGGGAVMVRACPERHRFDPLGRSAVAAWSALAADGTVLALDASECGLHTVAAIARAVPKLTILALSPGYRDLRRLVELLVEAPGVHVETGTLISAGSVEWLAQTAGPGRLVFGSGAPLWDDAGPRFQLDHLQLPPADVALIAHGNWDRLTGHGE